MNSAIVYVRAVPSAFTSTAATVVFVEAFCEADGDLEHGRIRVHVLVGVEMRRADSRRHDALDLCCQLILDV